jgi:hypothetical protein
MEPISLLHCPQEVSTDLYPEPDESSPYTYPICIT